MRLYCSASGQYEAVESHKINSKVLNICVALLALTTTLPAVTASETSQSLTATGKVAIYGILFDSSRAGGKAECKALLDEIDKLLKGDAKLKPQLVGHTDNNGGLEPNFDLSKRGAGEEPEGGIGAVLVVPVLTPAGQRGILVPGGRMGAGPT